MVSYTTVALAMGIFIAVSGPKDIHRYARIGGRLLGRAVGFMKMTKGDFDNVMGKSQMSEVHKELKEALAQVDAIRHEIRTGFSFTGSAYSREVYPDSQGPTPASSTVASQTVATATTSTTSKDSSSQQGFDVAAVTLASAQGTGMPFANLDHSSEQPRKNFYDQELQRNSKAGVDFVKMEVSHFIGARRPHVAADKEVDVIPVSAAIAKLIPERTGPAAGSDIMLEAVEEMKVASHALRFMKEHANQLTQQRLPDQQPEKPEQAQHERQ